jgi:hypothetical protein
MGIGAPLFIFGAQFCQECLQVSRSTIGTLKTSAALLFETHMIGLG